MQPPEPVARADDYKAGHIGAGRGVGKCWAVACAEVLPMGAAYRTIKSSCSGDSKAIINQNISRREVPS